METLQSAATSKPTVGFVGLGAVGAPVAARLIDAGFRVQVFDAETDALRYFLMEIGGEIAATPRLMAEACDLVVVLLPRPAEVEAVAIGRDGVIHGFADGGLVVDMSCSPPAQTRALAKALVERGIGLVDAPPLGGVAELRARNLTLLVGGADETVESACPVLEAIGTRQIRTGGVGSAHAARAICGQLAALCLLASAEALLIGERAGLRPAALLEALNASPGANQATRSIIERHVLSGSFDSGLGLDAVLGDLGRALEVARTGGLPAPMSALGHEIWASARLALGHGADHTRLVRWLEQVSKTELRSRPSSR